MIDRMHIRCMHSMDVGVRLHMRLGSPQVSMLGLLVPPQIHLSLEGATAQLACKRLEAGMLAGVGDQVGALTEGLAAHLAFVRLLACWKGRKHVQ